MTTPSADDADQELLHRVADGESEALGALYDRWGPRIHGVAYWILQDSDDAEDVVEETFWQVWQTARRYDWRRGAGSSWVLMIARSRALDRLRSLRRHDLRTRDLAEAEPQALPPGDEPDAALAGALRELSPEQREVVELAFFGGLTHAEIATRTALPLGTVKTRIRLALRKLRRRLAILRREGP